MTRNQKIALGCGGAGCLGLIVVVIAGGLIYFFSVRRAYTTGSSYNYNVNTRNWNYNSNSNDNYNSSTATAPSTSTSASSLSEDDKHKLYYAAWMTGETELINRVSVKLGLMDDDYTPGDNYKDFIEAHAAWSIRNTNFIRSIDTPEKARAYVNANLPN